MASAATSPLGDAALLAGRLAAGGADVAQRRHRQLRDVGEARFAERDGGFERQLRRQPVGDVLGRSAALPVL